MKKFFTFALAAATLVGFSACSNEEQNINADKGYINLGITMDEMVATRATATASEWYAYVTDNDGAFKWGESGTKWVIGSTHDANTLNTKPFSAGTYTVSVSNYQNIEAALAANSPYGAAYYEKNGESVTVNAGETANPTIECGKAKNAQLTVSATGFAGTALSVAITGAKTVNTSTEAETDQDRSMTFTWTKDGDTWDHSEAYFKASDETNNTVLSYTITYNINTFTDKTAEGTITLGTAGTRKNLKIASNDQGNIVLTITYDDVFTYNSESDQEVITIDGSTGNKVTE